MIVSSNRLLRVSAGALLLLASLGHADPARPSVLPVTGFGDAVVVAPTLAGRRPVLVVLHGNGDHPESICPAFDALAGGRAWIVCPRGVKVPGAPSAWTFPPDTNRVGAEVRAAKAALAKQWPSRVSEGPVLLAGFSLGAMYAAFLAARDPATFGRSVIIDTHHVWSRAEQLHFAANGGQAALFACSRTFTEDCRRLCGSTARAVANASITCLGLPDREHGYDRVLFDRLRAGFQALVAADDRWR